MTRSRTSPGRASAYAASVACVAGLIALFATPASAASGYFSSSLSTFYIPATAPTGTQGPAGEYPSSIQVAGLPGSISDVNVTLTNLDHPFIDDLDVLLVSPGSQTAMVLSDAGGGGGNPFASLSFNDEDNGPVQDSSPPPNGTYKPSDYTDSADSFPPPAPGGPYGPTLSALDGGPPNGQWSLYIVDDSMGDWGTLDGGWQLEITTDEEPPDANAPDTEITSGPKDVTKKTTATFTFRSNDPGASFRCGVDGQTLKAPCASPYQVKVKKGKHTFQVQAVDQAGNADPLPDSDSWTVKKKKKKK